MKKPPPLPIILQVVDSSVRKDFYLARVKQWGADSFSHCQQPRQRQTPARGQVAQTLVAGTDSRCLAPPPPGAKGRVNLPVNFDPRAGQLTGLDPVNGQF